MGVKERRERVKSETRDKILDAARELFTSEGYEGVSMRQVAEKIEYSPTAIYLHFADKEQLFHELVHEDFARLATVFQSAAMPANPVDRIREIGRTYVEFGTHYPNHYKLMLVGQVIAEVSVADGLRDPDLISQTLWAAVHGVISLQIAKCNDGWVDWRPLKDRATLMLDVTLRGMLKESN